MSPRVLFKAHIPVNRPIQLAIARERMKVQIEPLFSSRPLRSFGTRSSPQWFLMKQADGDQAFNAWDYCHHLKKQGFGIRGEGGVEFAEPDLEQRWIFDTPRNHALALTESCDQAAPPYTEKGIPNGDSRYWFRESSYTGLEKARDLVGEVSPSDRVRIAHFDTGYDPKHGTLPRFLRRDLQKNFVDGDLPNDASDRSSGIFNSLGHGTGTLGILAGGVTDGEMLGGAANLDIVPIRVADTVVLFRNSAIARALDYIVQLHATKTPVHVITMSMGGLASQAWAEAINTLYELGVFIVTAAGNNFSNLPTGRIVFPARFNRVVAACGVMSDGRPYADLPFGVMAGNYGPDQKMATAMAAYTPNTPWARMGCSKIVDFNGCGTSSATPQIASAAALWIQHNRKQWEKYSEGWMKVEAVRNALFTSAHLPSSMSQRLGRGILRARNALDKKPVAESVLRKQPADSASFPFLQLFTYSGVRDRDERLRMLELEALQLTQQSPEIEDLISDKTPNLRRIAEAMIAHPTASATLRETLQERAPATIAVRPAAAATVPSEPRMTSKVRRAMAPQFSVPEFRSLRVFASDPLKGARLETLGLNEATLEIPWEPNLSPGPVGEYLAVVDVDPSADCAYAPVDLNDPALLARSGLRPSESNPLFHQQMVYAVAMKTIKHFEYALGRVALWAPRMITRGAREEEEYVQRLRIYPHGLREANAYYSPQKKALMFGYFKASEEDPGENLPGGIIFSCLSHDIVAHETTHALLDGLHRRFQEPSNLDVLAFHEAFADIVALFQHFTLPEALSAEIAKTQGDLKRQNLLGELAHQFGQGLGMHGALRSAIGREDEKTKKWQPAEPSRTDYQNATEAHARGAVLVAAVFDAFLEIYRARCADLIRLATSGTGVLPPGDIPIDLVRRLAEEASKTARHILNMCIRALDYCPPLDITFGEYLRALITADRDLVPTDPLGYRVAFIQAFRRRGIYPSGVRHLSSETLCWETPEVSIDFEEILESLNLRWDLNSKRDKAFETSNINRKQVDRWIKGLRRSDVEVFGVIPKSGTYKIHGVSGTLSPAKVHSVRPLRRIGPDDQQRTHLIVDITQGWVTVNGDGEFHGGCTVIVDLESRQVQYCVRKRVGNADRVKAQYEFSAMSSSNKRNREPFAMLHRGHYDS